MWAGLHQWLGGKAALIEDAGGGGRAAPIEDENWIVNGLKFQLLHWGISPTGFRALSEGFGHLFGRVCPDGLLNYWAPAKNRARLRKRTGLLTSGDFSYYMGPIARWVSGVTGWVWGFIRAFLPQWLELLGAVGKAAPFENESWAPNVWELQLLHGAHRPLGFGRYRMGVGIYSGVSAPMA